MLRAALILSLAVTSVSVADDDVAKQKAAIAETVAKLKLKTTTVVETADLLVSTTLPDAKAKTLADAAQRAVTVARDNLGIAKEDSITAGKLALYVFADFSDLKSFIRLVEQRRPESDTFTMNLRATSPYIAVSSDAGAKLVEADLTAAAAGWAAAAVLVKKVGFGGEGRLPEWLQRGYGRACFLRSEPAGRQATARAKIKSVVGGKGKNVVWAKDIWSGEKLLERDLVTGSFIEYLAFGPNAEKFLALAKQMKPNLINETPMMDGALLVTLEMNVDAADTAWKIWAIKGK